MIYSKSDDNFFFIYDPPPDWSMNSYATGFDIKYKQFYIDSKMITVLQRKNITLKIKSVAYSSQGSHTGQLDFFNWLADGSTTG